MKWLLILLTTLLFACNDADSNREITTAEKQIIGEWNSLSIRIEINSKRNSEINEVFEVDRAQWEEKFKIKPIRTFFRADGTWNSLFYNLQNSLQSKSSGKWRIEGRKLTMTQIKPSVDTTVFTFDISNDTISFEAMIDWDSDGKKDDKHFSKQIKAE